MSASPDDVESARYTGEEVLTMQGSLAFAIELFDRPDFFDTFEVPLTPAEEEPVRDLRSRFRGLLSRQDPDSDEQYEIQLTLREAQALRDTIATIEDLLQSNAGRGFLQEVGLNVNNQELGELADIRAKTPAVGEAVMIQVRQTGENRAEGGRDFIDRGVQLVGEDENELAEWLDEDGLYVYDLPLANRHVGEHPSVVASQLENFEEMWNLTFEEWEERDDVPMLGGLLDNLSNVDRQAKFANPPNTQDLFEALADVPFYVAQGTGLFRNDRDGWEMLIGQAEDLMNELVSLLGSDAEVEEKARLQRAISNLEAIYNNRSADVVEAHEEYFNAVGWAYAGWRVREALGSGQTQDRDINIDRIDSPPQFDANRIFDSTRDLQDRFFGSEDLTALISSMVGTMTLLTATARLDDEANRTQLADDLGPLADDHIAALEDAGFLDPPSDKVRDYRTNVTNAVQRLQGAARRGDVDRAVEEFNRLANGLEFYVED